MRNLRDANVFTEEAGEPTRQQLYNKIAHIKHKLGNNGQILNTHELREAIAPLLEIPEDDLEAFVNNYEIDDEEEEVRFIIIFTSKKLMARIHSDRVCGCPHAHAEDQKGNSSGLFTHRFRVSNSRPQMVELTRHSFRSKAKHDVNPETWKKF